FDGARAEGWADPRRLHAEGRRARLLRDGARQVFADALGCRPAEIQLSPNHTMSLHAAVLAVSRGRRRTGTRVIASAVERAAVLSAATAAGEPQTVPVDRQGRVDLDAWTAAVSAPGVGLAALQHANGEVGTVQPVDQARRAAAAAGVPLLVDAGTSLGHLEGGPAWDLLAVDPQDWGGPAGIGVLAVRSGVRAVPVAPEDEDRWFPGGVSIP